MTISNTPPCLFCDRMKDEDKDNFNFVCEAYPKGIPIEIVDMDVIHNKPLKGDMGLMYKGILEPLEDENDNI